MFGFSSKFKILVRLVWWFEFVFYEILWLIGKFFMIFDPLHSWHAGWMIYILSDLCCQNQVWILTQCHLTYLEEKYLMFSFMFKNVAKLFSPEKKNLANYFFVDEQNWLCNISYKTTNVSALKKICSRSLTYLKNEYHDVLLFISIFQIFWNWIRCYFRFLISIQHYLHFSSSRTRIISLLNDRILRYKQIERKYNYDNTILNTQIHF